MLGGKAISALNPRDSQPRGMRRYPRHLTRQSPANRADGVAQGDAGAFAALEGVEGIMNLKITPCSLAEANNFVLHLHRHHKPVVGHKFSIAVSDLHPCGGVICGVAIVGRPVARNLDDGATLEVTRLCTDGTRNACSMLYRSAWRAARAMGYSKLVTYTLATESGSSLKGAGFRCVAQTKGGTWNRPSRGRVDKHSTEAKLRWEIA